jgi:hypothetical protein
MANKKILGVNHIVEVLFNEDNLIPETDHNESSDSERTRSPEITLISDNADKATPETSPGYHPPLLTVYSKHRPE